MATATLLVVLLAAVCPQSFSEPAPQFTPSGFRPQHHGDRRWAQSPRNHSFLTPDFLDPETSPVGEDPIRRQVPRQSGYYGPPNPLPGFEYPGRNQNPFPPPPAQPSGYPYQGSSQGFFQGFPQIYKVDNLIIIANPPQQQCMTSNLKPLDPNTFPGADNDPENRFGENDEPSKCTWAIVACCAPGSSTVRYNCFELMGCNGQFLGQNPCTPQIVEAATSAALAFYRKANNNSTSAGTDNNRV